MTDVTKVGGNIPSPVNRPSSTKSSKAESGSSQASGTSKASETASTSETFRLPPGVAGADNAGKSLSAAAALDAVLSNLQDTFGAVGDNPPATGADLENLLSNIKVAAPVLDKILAARKNELIASGDQSGLSALDSTLAGAQDAVSQAQSGLESLAANLPSDTPQEDPALTAALNAVLGEGHSIPTFSADELQQGRQEFVGLVFGDITDAIGRHRGADAQAASYTLSSLGGANLTA